MKTKIFIYSIFILSTFIFAIINFIGCSTGVKTIHDCADCRKTCEECPDTLDDVFDHALTKRTGEVVYGHLNCVDEDRNILFFTTAGCDCLEYNKLQGDSIITIIEEMKFRPRMDTCWYNFCNKKKLFNLSFQGGAFITDVGVIKDPSPNRAVQQTVFDKGTKVYFPALTGLVSIRLGKLWKPLGGLTVGGGGGMIQIDHLFDGEKMWRFPLFGRLRYTFPSLGYCQPCYRFFVFGDYGTVFDKYSKNIETIEPIQNKFPKIYPYFALGAGFELQLAKYFDVSLSAAYTSMRISEQFRCPTCPPADPNIIKTGARLLDGFILLLGVSLW